MDSNNIWVAIVASVSGSGILAALLDWFRNRRKDAATAKLTDVQVLQTQLTYVEGVAEYLRKHNDTLQKDYEALDAKYRAQRERVSELEADIDKLRRSAAQTQIECDQLSRRLDEVLGRDDDDIRRS